MKHESMRKSRTSVTPLAETNVLQRACDCGQHTHGSGQCAACRNKQTASRTETQFIAGRGGTDFIRVPISRSEDDRPQRLALVGAPNDRFEREADLLADSVLRSSLPRVATTAGAPHVQRACKKCEEENI